jgi:hypothetical protein
MRRITGLLAEPGRGEQLSQGALMVSTHSDPLPLPPRDDHNNFFTRTAAVFVTVSKELTDFMMGAIVG